MSRRPLGRLGSATAVAALAITVAALSETAVAAGDPIGVHLSLGPGLLSVSVSAVPADAAGPVRVPLTIVDARGSGAGWTLRARSSAPVTVASVTVACGRHSTCTLPRATLVASGEVVLRAAPGTGLGVMRLVVVVDQRGGRHARGRPLRLSFTVT